MTCDLRERSPQGALRKATRDRATQRTGLLSNDRTPLTTKRYFYPHCQPPRGPANGRRKTDPQRTEKEGREYPFPRWEPVVVLWLRGQTPASDKPSIRAWGWSPGSRARCP